MLYLQGDYDGAVRELVVRATAWCRFYTILKDIGQAYERELDYEQAIGYLERYVEAVPPTRSARTRARPIRRTTRATSRAASRCSRSCKAQVCVETVAGRRARSRSPTTPGVAARGALGRDDRACSAATTR